MPPLPALIGQKRVARNTIVKRRSVGTGSLGAFAGKEVELRQLETLVF